MAFRLQFRHKKLLRVKDEIENVLVVSDDGSAVGISEESVITGRIKLQHAIDSFDKELRNCPDLETQELEKYIEDQSQAEDLLIKLNAAHEIYRHNQKRTPIAGPSMAKLPKLQWEKFRGDILKFTEFWDKFEANVDSRDLRDVEKLSYLLSSLEGPALETVSGLATTNDNYSIPVDTLRKKYGSTDLVIDAHHHALNNIKRVTEDHLECRQALDSIEKHLRVLQTLGENMESNHLRVMIASKFPERIMYQVNLLSPDDHTVPALRTNLSRVISAMERSGVSAATTLDVTSPLATTEALHVRTEMASKRTNLKRKSNDSSAGPSKRMRQACVFCDLSGHRSHQCKKFPSVEARTKKLEGRCLMCLKPTHATEKCNKGIQCFNCNGNHLVMLCPKLSGEVQDIVNLRDMTTSNMSNETTFLQTAVATMRDPNSNKRQKCRLLLDSGSQRSYITSKAANALGLTSTEEDQLLIYTFGAESPTQMTSPATEIMLETKRDVKRTLSVNVVPRITDHVPIAKCQHDSIDVMADEDSVGKGIDILIGNDFYCSFLRDGKIRIGKNLYLIDSDFGWILSGNTAQKETDALSVATYCQCHIQDCPYFTEPDLPLRNIDIKFLWSLESIGIMDSPKATRQEQAISHFNETVQYTNGRYQVKWPWIQYPPHLISNFGLALGRLKSLMKRMDTDSLNEYNAILKEQLDLGIIEVAQPRSNTVDHPVHYLPHHIVKQKGKRGRIVYDASAKVSGHKSLNECLYSGPSMLEDLTGLLLKFRTNQIGIVADVEKAFLQVGLQQEDRDVTRFLWIRDPSKDITEENLLHLRFCRVPFGVISSPFLLTAAIRHHMSKSGSNLLKNIADKCYVDNLVTGANTAIEAGNLYSQTKSTFEELSMNIRDWVSNSKEFMETVPQKDKATHSPVVKVLGLTWDTEGDMLKLKITKDNFHPETPVQTKREVLRTLARVYDPCGFGCALTLEIKLLFQKICQERVKWDAPLPEHLMKSLKLTLENLNGLMQVEIPRFLGVNTANENAEYELHCFTDASNNSYAAVTYIRSSDRKVQQEATVSFVMAKSRVAQIQDKDDLKIPKLELLGYLIGSRLLKYVHTNLDVHIKKQYLWTDSLVVLGWMNSNKLLPPFVANRVNEIKRNHPETEMCYIHTKSNPADIATRPEPELWDQRKELWYGGPTFLKVHESCWPESRHYTTHTTLISSGEGPGETSEEMEVRDWSEVDRIQDVHMEIDSPDSMEEVVQENTEQAEHNVTEDIKLLQSEYFHEEQMGKTTHLTRNLNLFLDKDGLLRCGGRMANAMWNYDMKYPILLPQDCDFTNQLIMKTHERNYHVGASHTLSIIRERYWIPQGKAKVTKVLKKCKQCVRHGGGPYKLPNAPPLPSERVNFCEPWSFTGLDYFGPVFVATPSGKEKRWVALFTCLTVRAISLEIVQNISAQECLLALRRFAATRAVPKRIYSDNASCFKLTAEVTTKPYCIENRIEWKFIPELAPWHGGYYERLIALVKHCLKRTLGKHLLNDSQLLTVMKEVEAVVNTRPLTRVGTEVEHILRPADFLTLGKCLTTKEISAEVPASDSRVKANLIESWKRGQQILREFKEMFIGQYLMSLRERSKHTPKEPRVRSDREPQVGDLVQIKADSKNRINWKIGKIIALIKGADGKCRVARVKVNDQVYTRSIGHLYPLEEDTADTASSDDHGVVIEPVEDLMPAEITPTRIPCIEASQSQDGEVQVHEDTSIHVPEVIPQTAEIQTSDEACGPELCNASDERVAVTEHYISFNPELEEGGTSGVTENQEPARVRREAAVRAREKIREWTRHLLVLLK